MKETLYAFRKLGYARTLLYLFIYPVRFFKNRINRLNEIHYEIRWNKEIFGYLQKLNLPLQTSMHHQKKSEAENYFKGYGLNINGDWVRFYKSLSGINEDHFIPDHLFFKVIEPALNNRSLSPYYTDKNNYGIILKDFRQPGTVLRFINGNYYDQQFNLLSGREAETLLPKVRDKWIIKPSVGSGGGKGVHIGYSDGGHIVLGQKKLKFSALADKYRRGFIIQKLIEQHQELSLFHSASLNTFRVITLRLNGEINYLTCVVKFGVNNNIIDNSGTGAVWCGVHQNGLMHSFGLTQQFKKIKKHPTSGHSFSDTRFSFFPEVIKFAKSMHHHVFHMDIISWDIAVDLNENPVLIEFNPKHQGIIGCQAANGPLFGDLTGDVLAEVAGRRSSIRK